MPTKRLLAIADRAVWEKVAKGRAGIRWDSVVEKERKAAGRNQEEILSIAKLAGYKTEAKGRIETRQRLALRKKVKEAEHLRDLRGVKRRNRNEKVFARPGGLQENAETAIFV